MRSYARWSLKTMVSVLLALHVAAITYAADATWNGSASSDWSNSANWDAGVLPNSGGNVYLNALGNAPTNQDIVGLTIQNIVVGADFTNGITIAGEEITMDGRFSTSTDNPVTVHHTILCDLTINRDMQNYFGPATTTIEFAGNVSGAYYVQNGGYGSLIISGSNNTYSGATRSTRGNIYFYDDENLGTPPATPTPGNLYASSGYLHLAAPSGANFHKSTINANRGLYGRFSVDDDNELQYAGAIAPNGTTFLFRGGGVQESIIRLSGDSSATLIAGKTVRVDNSLIVMESAAALGSANLQSVYSVYDFNGYSRAGDMNENNNAGMLDGMGGREAHYVNNKLGTTSVLSGDYKPTYQTGASYAFGGRGDIKLTGGVYTSSSSGNFSLRKRGSGVLTLAGTNSFNYGPLLMGGELILDHTTDNSPKISSGSAQTLSLYGASVTLLGNDTTASTEMVGTLYSSADSKYSNGRSFLSVQAGNADATFSFGSFSMKGGYGGNSPIDFQTSTTGTGIATIIGRTAANEVSGILSPAATFNGETWATVAVNSNIVGLADGSFTPTLAPDVHWDVPNGTTTVSVNSQVDSVRFDDPAGAMTVNIDARLFLNQFTPSFAGGILMTPQAGGAATISGAGYLRGANFNNGFVIHQYNTNYTLTISAQIRDNINNGLTKTGPGEVILSNDNNAFDAAVGVYGGTLTFTSINDRYVSSSLGAGLNSDQIDIGTATLKYIGTGHTTDRPIWITGLATLEAAGSGTLRLTNAVAIRTSDVQYSPGSQTLILTGAGDGQVDGNVELGALGGLYKRGTGTWTLNADNTYRYPTVIEEGTLAINGSMRGDVEVQSGGTLKSSGATFKRDLTIDGTLAYDITATSTNMIVWGEVTLGGDLEITNTGGSDEGTIITSDYPITGTFSSVTYGYEVTYNENSVVLGIAPPQGTLLIVK